MTQADFQATLATLLAQETRTVYLLAQDDGAVSVPEGTPGALAFQIVRVPASKIRSNLLYAALGQDGYAKYAAWYNQQAQQAFDQAQAQKRKPGDPEPFDDSQEQDQHWRAHNLALEEAAERAVLEAGVVQPELTPQLLKALTRYRKALLRAIVQWDREGPEWSPPVDLPEDPTPEQVQAHEENEQVGKASRPNSGPP